MKKFLLLAFLFTFYANAAILPETPQRDSKGCYLISTVEELYGFEKIANSFSFIKDSTICAKLENDIVKNKNLTDNVEYAEADSISPILKCSKTKAGCAFEEWTPIGKYAKENSDALFIYFDGQGHTISGLYINKPDSSFTAFIGYAYGTVKNLNIADSYIRGNYNAAGIVGRQIGTLQSCSFSGVVIGNKYVAGIIARNNGFILNSHNDGDIWGENYVGGITGESVNVIDMCYNTGRIYGQRGLVAGIAGLNEYLVTRCYNTGNITGLTAVGGIIGKNYEFTGDDTLQYCFNMGQIKGKSIVADVGAIVGVEERGRTSDCYALEGTAEKLLVKRGKDSTHIEETVKFIKESEFTDSTLIKRLKHRTFLDAWQQGKTHPIHKNSSPKIKDGAFMIENEAQLAWFNVYDKYVGSHEDTKVVLMNDLEFNKNVIESGCWYADSLCKDLAPWRSLSALHGVFDGNGHVISGLYVEDTSYYGQEAGLFKNIYGTVKNLAIVNSYFAGKYVGSFASSLNGIIDGCYVRNNIVHEFLGGYSGMWIGRYYSKDTIINNEVLSEDLWFNGKRHAFFKNSKCIFNDTSMCYIDADWKDYFGSDRGYGITPYKPIKNPFTKKSGIVRGFARDPYQQAMDSLGYIPVKYKLGPTQPKNKESFIIAMIPTTKPSIDISELNGFCATYTSDHDAFVQFQGFYNESTKSTNVCQAKLPKTKEPKTITFSIKDFKYQNNVRDSLKQIDCIKATESAERLQFAITDSVDTEGIFRIFEFGPKGTCEGNKKIAKEPDFCHLDKGSGINVCENDSIFNVKDSNDALPSLSKSPKPKMEFLGNAISFYGTSSQAKFQIVNLKGEVVKKGFAKSTVQLQGLKQGVYVVQLQDKSFSQSKMISPLQ
jgi:hypothetical protein